MEIFFRNQVNLWMFIILGFVCAIAYKKLDKTDSWNRSFLITAVGVMLGLLMESGSVVFNHNDAAYAIALNNIFSVLIFAIAPLIAFHFFVFIFHLVLPGMIVKKTWWWLFALPIFSNVILAFLSPSFGFFFSVSAEGVYSRGPLFLLSAASTYVYMISGVLLVLLNYKRILGQDFWLILGIGIFPILGGIIQSLFYGVLAMWSSAGVALLLGFLFLQDRMIRLDSLTGAWNRESFYFIYTRHIQMYPDKKFGAIYFDIDNLKLINDTYGHLEGDNAIRIVMKEIREIIPDQDVLCRLGGDEFIIIHDCETLSEIESLRELIQKRFIQIQTEKQFEYPLECSYGTALFSSEYVSLDAFLSKLDILMYEEKFAKKK
ncbi:MAG: diguanylate cyclase [Bacilli bacterium]|nr:diguanylate cyclase [Bacilli bacterium]MBN2876171.1 diguanylate cyclase [Bacilli bacterium]